MTIGFDAKRAFNNTTGLGTYSRTLIEGLLRFEPSQRYVLFTPSERIRFIEGTSTVSIIKPQHFLHRQFPWYWRSFYLPVEERNAGLDIYHGLSNELPFGKAPAGIRQVVTIHDLIFLKYPQYYSWIDRAIYEMKVRHSCQIADCIIAVSEQTKRDLAEWLPDTEEKIKVVYQSCAPAFEKEIAPDELARIKGKYGLPERFILYVGTLSERKNLLNAVKAFSSIAGAAEDVHLILAGEGGAYKLQLERLAQSLGLNGRVRLISGISDVELPAVYRSASLFVYPSVYEGFGIPIMEALWSRVPVVATRGGCFPEAGGPHSCYVNTEDADALARAMLEVLTNRQRAVMMAEEGARYAEKFRGEAAVRRMMRIYEAGAGW
ncbi:MAG TPA: glycosyltransferase family 1 protein [Chitinophagales bacterium]|nr:glycosyltransferase family 1 protein [Chitinophagales bacterium]